MQKPEHLRLARLARWLHGPLPLHERELRLEKVPQLALELHEDAPGVEIDHGSHVALRHGPGGRAHVPQVLLVEADVVANLVVASPRHEHIEHGRCFGGLGVLSVAVAVALVRGLGERGGGLAGFHAAADEVGHELLAGHDVGALLLREVVLLEVPRLLAVAQGRGAVERATGVRRDGRVDGRQQVPGGGVRKGEWGTEVEWTHVENSNTVIRPGILSMSKSRSRAVVSRLAMLAAMAARWSCGSCCVLAFVGVSSFALLPVLTAAVAEVFFSPAGSLASTSKAISFTNLRKRCEGEGGGGGCERKRARE